MIRSACLTAFAIAATAASAAKAENNVLLILDASNSMWGQVDGTAKIETARGVLGDLLGDVAEGSKVGVMAYGHGDKESCTDVSLLAPIGANSADKLKKTVNDISPKGKTPIAYALEQGAKELAKYEQDTNNIVLISDGIETCEGDPCEAAKKLAAANVNTKVHVVGFDVDEETRKQLQCIAEKGKGKYFDASNTQGFKTAIAEVKKVAAKPVPAVKEAKLEPAAGAWYEDNFDGSGLSSDWEVLNENKNNYVVDGGNLTVVFSGDKSMFTGEVENIFRLKKGVPEGDWQITMRIVPEVQTMRERFHLALMKDANNMMHGSTGYYVECCGYHATIGLWSTKRADGKNTEFKTKMHYSDKLGGFQSGTENVKNFTSNVEKYGAATEMRITKKGRDYVVSARLEADNGTFAEWVELEKLNSLRLPGDAFVMAFNQAKFTNRNYQVEGGESVVNVDWIKIESLQ